MNKSKLVLGTVQLGMQYGVNNSAGPPSQGEAFAILDTAYDAGINTLDTAHAYGNAEKVIGAWLTTRRIKDIYLITKFKPTVLEELPGTPVTDSIETQLHTSLERLGVERVDGYLLPEPQYLYLDDVIEGLQRVKEKGLTRNIGVSTYDEEDALKVIDMGIDYIQIPYNAFDQRLDRTNFFQRAAHAGVTVFARSPFLQGLLLMDPKKIPPHLASAKEHVERFRAIAQKHGLSALEASLVFVYKRPSIAHIVFGVEKLSQIEQGLRAIEIGANNSYEDLILEIQSEFKNVDRAVVNPSLWSIQTKN